MRKPFREENIFKTMEEYLGVRYVYEEIESQSQKEQATQESLQEKVNALPEELKEQLNDSLLTGNLERIAIAIAKIRQSDNTLADAIKKCCDRFEYYTILNWLST